jgi:WD40 repeat protein
VFATDSPEVEVWALPHAPTSVASVVTLGALPYGAAFSPRGDRLAVVGSDLVARISLAPTLSTLELPVDTWPTAIAWPRAGTDDGLLALYENTERISLREPDQGRVLDVVHLPPASGARLVAGGERLALLPTEGHSSIADAVVLRHASGGGFESVHMPAGVRDIALDTPRRRVVVATLTSVWSVPISGGAGLTAAVHLADMPEGVGIVQRLLVLADGRVAVVSLRGALLLAGPPGDDAIEVVRPVPAASFASALVGAAVSPDGHDVYTGAAEGGRVLRWSVSDHAEATPLEGGDETVSALAVSADGAYLASGARDGSLRLWNLRTHAVEHTVTLGSSPVTAIVFSPRGDRVACADQTGALRIVAVASGNVLREAHPHARWINGLSWSADARWIVSTSDDRSVGVLAADSLAPVRIVRTSAAPISAALMNDGTHLVYHDGRDVVRLDLRMSMETPDGAALLAQAEERAGMRLAGLALVAR